MNEVLVRNMDEKDINEKIKKYDISGGDIIFCKGHSKYSLWLMRFQWNNWSHCGLIVNVNGELWILESTCNDIKINDFYSGKPKEGVQLVKLKDKLRYYKGEIGIRKLLPKSSKMLNDEIFKFYLKEHEKGFEQSNMEMVRSGCTWLFGLNKKNTKFYFCSELVAEALQEVKLILQKFNCNKIFINPSNEYTPSDLQLFRVDSIGNDGIKYQYSTKVFKIKEEFVSWTISDKFSNFEYSDNSYTIEGLPIDMLLNLIDYLECSDDIMFENIRDFSPVEQIMFSNKFTHYIKGERFNSFGKTYDLKMMYGEMKNIKVGKHCILFKNIETKNDIFRSFDMKSVTIDSTEDSGHIMLLLIPDANSDQDLDWVIDRILEYSNDEDNIVKEILSEQKLYKSFKLISPEFDDLFMDSENMESFMSFNANGIYDSEEDFELPQLSSYNKQEMDLILNRPFIAIILDKDTKEIVLWSLLYEPHNPFKSEAQRRFLHMKHPKLAKKWEHRYHRKGKLPYHKKKKRKKGGRRKRRRKSKRRRRVARRRFRRKLKRWRRGRRRRKGRRRGRRKRKRR